MTDEATYAHDASCNTIHTAGPQPCPPPRTTRSVIDEWVSRDDTSLVADARTPTTGWVTAWTRGAEYVQHLAGVDWYRAPLPRRWHRCKPQTRGRLSCGYVERCACGALRWLFGPWIERNSRRPR